MQSEEASWPKSIDCKSHLRLVTELFWSKEQALFEAWQTTAVELAVSSLKHLGISFEWQLPRLVKLAPYVSLVNHIILFFLVEIAAFDKSSKHTSSQSRMQSTNWMIFFLWCVVGSGLILLNLSKLFYPRYNVLIKDPRTGAYKVNFAKDIFPAIWCRELTQ